MLANIDAERKSLHLSAAALARMLNISTRRLEKWINCTEAIPANKLIEMSHIFGGCSIDYLLKRN